MKRERIAERERFDRFKADEIGWKSDNKCCHCGKEQWYGYGATIDHFIPLSKGGNNRDYNLIMLCKDCNEEKDDRVVDLSYIKEGTLRKEHMIALQGYYESYMSSFEFLNRNNIFKCDYYEVLLLSEKYMQMSKKAQAKIKPFGKKIISKSATQNDYQKLCDYYAEYLKKYGRFDDMESVEINIAFWMKWGAIYYIEDNKEITNMQVYMVRPSSGPEWYENTKYIMNMYIFSKYATDTAFSISYNLIQKLSESIMNEQKIPGFILKLSMIEEDKLTNQLYSALVPPEKDQVYLDYSGMTVSLLLSCIKPETYQKGGLTKDDLSNINSFMEGFGDVLKNKKELKAFKDTFPGEGYYWLLYDLFTPQQIKDMQLIPNTSRAYEHNEKLCEYQHDCEKQLKLISAKNSYKKNNPNYAFTDGKDIEDIDEIDR